MRWLRSGSARIASPAGPISALPPSRQQTGAAAESLALAHLEQAGARLLARNYRCRQGEVDLIMRDEDTIVFVEVRLRAAGALVSAAESIDPHKQRRIVTAARHYLAGRTESPCRFDCVLLDSLDAGAVRWVRNAFDA